MPAFNLKPTLSTYLFQAYAFGIMEQPSVPTLMLDWNIQWAFPNDKIHNPLGQFDFYPSLKLKHQATLGMLERFDLSPNLAELLEQGTLSETILRWLEEGSYVRLHADYFYIKNTTEYQARHFRHDYLIFDQRAATREFLGATYTRGGGFGLAPISWDDLPAAVTLPNAPTPKTKCHWRDNLLVALRRREEPEPPRPLDLAAIKVQLSGYLHSSHLAHVSLGHRLMQHFCRADALQPPAKTFGLNVYDRVREYGRWALAAEGNWFDPRTTRLIWEHKKLMRIRLARISHEQMSAVRALLSDWEKIEELAFGLHLRVTAAQRRNERGLFAPLDSELDTLKTLEADFIPRLIEMF
jgi:hypothetical protein